MSFNSTIAAPNYEINYQGKLTNGSAVAVPDGDYDMEFSLYTSPTGGSPVWTETLTGSDQVPVLNGLFSVMLGSTTPLTSVDFNQTLYLGVSIEADAEMTPRKILGAVPAAFEAENAQTVGGVASTSFLRSDQADVATGLLTFSNGFLSQASSSIARLTTITATTTNLVINSERFTDLTGTGLQNSSGVLTLNTTYLNTLYASTTAFDTSAELRAILSDETGTGNAVFSASPTFTGTLQAAAATLSSTLTLSGSAANIALGSNYLSGDGGDEGIFIDSTGRVGVGTALPNAKLSIDATLSSFGTELITNGTFTGSATGWDLQTDCSEYSSGTVVVLYDAGCQAGADYAELSTTVSLVEGTTYRLSIDVVTNGDQPQIYFDNISFAIDSIDDGTHVYYFVADYTAADTMHIESVDWGNDTGWTIDNVSIREVPESPLFFAKDYTGATSTVIGGALNNLILGRNALTGATRENNVGIGINAGYGATNAYESFFAGTDAGYGAQNANYSIFIGPDAGYNGRYAAQSIFLGYRAGYNASSSANATFIGTNAGSGATNALGANFLGQGAGQGATHAAYVNFFGSSAGSNATNTQHSNFFGDSAGSSAAQAQFSNFSGYLSGLAAQNAAYSNFFGREAGRQATNANNSNFLGYQAGRNATDASYANFFGASAGYGAANASGSNFLGNSAGSGASSANYSNFLGTSAGYNAIEATRSNFLGYYSGFNASNASHSIFIGAYSGYSDTVDNFNVDGTSIAIGQYSGTGGFSNSIALGRGVINSAATQLNIGNLLYGTGIYNSDTQSASAVSAGRLGIGTSTPNQILSLFRNGADAAIEFSTVSGANEKWTIGIDDSDGTKFKISSSSALGTNDRFVIDGSGRVGIGISSPAQRFVVALGSSEIAQFNDGTNASAIWGQNIGFLSELGEARITTRTTSPLAFFTGGSLNSMGEGTERMRILTTGEVGIGTSTPSQELTVSGDVRVTGRIYDSSNSAGTNGMVLKSTGTGFTWVATSTLGFGTVTGSGSANRVAYWSGASALTSDSTFTFANSKLTAPVFNASGASTTLLSVGNFSLLQTSTSSASIALGFDSGDAIMNGSSWGNIAIGDFSMSSSTVVSGDENVAIGVYSLANNTNGFENVAVGPYTLLENRDGAGQVAIGSYALTTNRTGQVNTAVGAYAMEKNVSGGSNTAVGYSALWSNISGEDNTALGINSLFANLSGSHNVAIGGAALYSNTSGIRNVGLGLGALSNNNATGSIAIGYQAGNNLTSGDRNILIGYDIDAPTATSDNILNIGNLLFGTGIDGTGTTLSSGNIGIGTSSPSQKLTVSGNLRVTGSIYDSANSAGTNGMVLKSTGTGFTWVATSTLGLGGSTITFGADDQIPFTNSGGTNYEYSADLAFSSTGGFKAGYDISSGGTITSSGSGSFAGGVLQGSGANLITASGGGSFAFGYTNGGTTNEGQITATTNGSVAMGAAAGADARITSSGIGSFALGYSDGTASLTATGEAAFALGENVNATANNTFALGRGFTNSTADSFGIGFGSQQFALIGSTGRVGIGTTTPNQKLSIFNNGADAAIEFSTISGANEKWTIGIDDSDGAKFKISSSSALGTNDRFVINGAGYVGIGTASPDSWLTVLPASGSSIGSRFYNDDQNEWIDINDDDTDIQLSFEDNTAGVEFSVGIYDTGDSFRISNSNSLNTNPVFTITSGTRLVGIGTTSPSAKLSIHAANGETNSKLFVIASSTAATTTDLFSVLNNGETYINSSFLSLNNTSGAAYLDVTGSGDANSYSNLTLGSTAGPYWFMSHRTGGAFGLYYTSDDITYHNPLMVEPATPTGTLYLDSTGNVGVGTTTPASELHVYEASGDVELRVEALTGGDADLHLRQGSIDWWLSNQDADNSFRLTYESSPYLTVTSGGLMGIGTTSPDRLLHLESNAPEIQFHDTDGTASWQMGPHGDDFILTQAGVWDVLTVVAYPNYVGIGTTTPGHDLHVVSQTGSASLMVENPWTTNAYLALKDTSREYEVFSNAGTFGVWDETAQDTRFAINTSGYVGIGISDALAELQIHDGDGATLMLSRDDTTLTIGETIGEMLFRSYDTSLHGTTTKAFVRAVAQSTFTGADHRAALHFGTGQGDDPATTAMVLTGEGRLGIGTTTPETMLDVYGNSSIRMMQNASTYSRMYPTYLEITSGSENVFLTTTSLSKANWGGDLALYTTTSGGVNNTSQLYLDSTGRVGVGTTTPGAALEVAGGISGATIFSLTRQTAGQANTWGTRISSSYTGVVGTLLLNPLSVAADLALSGAIDTTAPQFVIKGATGRIGIGTSTPNQKLSIFAAAADAAIEFSTVSGSSEKWTIGVDDSDGAKFKISSSSALGTNDRFVIDGNGDIGIATSTPLSKLSIVHAGGMGASESAAHGLAIYAGTNARTLYMGYDSTIDSGYISASRAGSYSDLALNPRGGSVNIGTSTGSQKLTIFSGDLDDAAIEFSTVSGANEKWTIGIDNSDRAKFKISSSSALGTNDRLVIDGSGRIGIGTSTPAVALDVNGSGYFHGNGTIISLNQYGAVSDLNRIAVTGNRAMFGYNGTNANAVVQAGASKGIEFNVNNGTFGSGQAAVITSAGNVGIGTTSPATKLDVVGSAQFSGSAATLSINPYGAIGHSNYIKFTNDRGFVGYNDGFTVLQSGAGKDIQFITDTYTFGSAADVAMVIGGGNDATAGNVGIGTVTPSQKLTVAGNVLLSSQSEAAIAWGTGYNGSQESITALTEFNGYLYAGQGSGTGDGDVLICTPSAAGVATDCDNASDWATSYDGAQEVIWGFAEFKGKLYAAQGSTLGTPQAGDGDIFVCNPATTGDTAKCDSGDWSTSRDSAVMENVFAMAEFNGRLYAVGGITTGTDGDIYVCNPDTAGTAGICDNASDWTTAYDGAQEGFASLAVFNGRIYAAQGLAAGDGDIYASSDGSTWAVSYNGAAEYFRGMTVYNGRLYAAQSATAAGSADVYMTTDGVAWTMSFNGSQEWLNAITVYNGSIYTAQGNGTGDGDIFSMTGSSTWATSYNGAEEEITSFAVYNGKLYAGQGNGSGNGDVLYMNQVATTSYALKFAAGNSTGDFWFAEESLFGAAGPNGEIGTFKLSHALVTTAGSFDVAEDYPTADKSLLPGDIVSYDPNRIEHLEKATAGKQSLLAGVVSGQPGFLLSSNDREGMVPTALVGRVPVRVSDENGSIEIGDSITISSEAGVGMKANFGDKSIGYALAPLDTNDSDETILIYVSVHYAFGMNPDPELFASASSTESLLEGGTIIERIAKLASGFVDGVLSTIGINTQQVNTATLCVGTVCVDEATFLNIVEQSGGGITPDPDPIVPDPVIPDDTASSTPEEEVPVEEPQVEPVPEPEVVIEEPEAPEEILDEMPQTPAS